MYLLHAPGTGQTHLVYLRSADGARDKGWKNQEKNQHKKVFLCGSCCMKCSNPDSLVESLLQPYLKPITIRIPAAKGRPDLVS